MTPAEIASMRQRGVIPRKPLAECPTEENPEVVLAEDLARVIQTMLAEDRKLHMTNGGQNEPGNPICLARVLEELHGITSRVIYRITKAESATVGLDLADRILTALELNINDETLEIEIHRKREVRAAVMLQTEMMMAQARARGQYVPPIGDPTRRYWPEVYRRKLAMEARTP